MSHNLTNGAPMTETAWMVNRWAREPKLVTITKRTAKMVFYVEEGRRNPSRTLDVWDFFATWEDARACLVKRAEETARYAEINLEQARKGVSAAMSLRNPQEPR